MKIIKTIYIYTCHSYCCFLYLNISLDIAECLPTMVSIVVCAIYILAEMLRSLVKGSCCLDTDSATCRLDARLLHYFKAL